MALVLFCVLCIVYGLRGASLCLPLIGLRDHVPSTGWSLSFSPGRDFLALAIYHPRYLQAIWRAGPGVHTLLHPRGMDAD